MAHESFENPQTAQIMNEHYINIKVDREERPDVDDIYMQAVQIMTRSGGWPMTVFLLPDGRPFYGGTYFPPAPRFGMPAFTQVLLAVSDAFNNRRTDVEREAASLTEMLDRGGIGVRGDNTKLTADLLDQAFAAMSQNADRQHGGISTGAPKFPNPMNLEFLLRTHARTGSQDALDIVTLTLEKMARGGIYDQIGGGFHRYSVDAIWLVPHFEKMLYDNAQLSRVYLHAWQITHNPFFKRIAEEVYDYILREMTNAAGGFYSTTDADSEGEEGKFFVWSQSELENLLGADAEVAVEYYGVTPGGNFEGHNILFVPNMDEIAARRLGLTVDELRQKLSAINDKLYAARTQRVHPGLDDKIITSWNGMMLASLAEAARVLNRDDYRTAAVRNGEFLLRELRDGGLFRTYKDGERKISGYLEDYANLIDGLLELYQTTFDERWFIAARELADHVLQHFADPEGGFFDTSDDAEALIVRPRSIQDNATPSGSSMIARQLIRLVAYTGEGRYDDAARGALRALTELPAEYLTSFAEALNAIDMLVVGQSEVAIVGEPAAAQPLLEIIQQPYRPNVITALSPTNVSGEATIPLLSYRTMRAGQPTVYVCRNFACQMPVTDPAAVRTLLETA